MGALDDLIAQDEENLRRSQGGQSELDKLLAMDEARNYPSNDPEIPTEEAPSFIGYDPATAQPKTSAWDDISELARGIMDPSSPANQQMISGGQQWRADQGGYGEILDNLGEAYVGAALPGAGKGAGLVRKAATEAAQSMGMTAADKAGEHMRSGEPVDLSKEAREVAESGLFGLAGGTAGHFVGKAAGAVKDWAGEAAAKAKNLVTGMGVRDAKATAAMHGVDAIDENYGGLLEKYSPSGFTGKSPKAHHEVVAREKEAVGDDLRALAQEINQGLVPDVPAHGSLMPGVPGDLGLARQRLDAELGKEGSRVAGALPEDQVQYGKAIGELRDRVVGRNPPNSFPALVGEKSALQGFAHSGPGQSVPEGAQKQAAAHAGGVLKDEVSRIVGQQPAPLRDRYVAQNQNFAELATLDEMLRNKAAAEASGGDLGGILGSSAAAGLVGAGTGAVLDDDPVAGAAKGGASAFLAGFGLQGGAGATRTAIRQAGGGRMTDAGANMLRGIESLAGGIDGSSSSAGLASTFAERRADSREQREKPGANVAIGESRVAELLQTNPAALSGFAPLLQQHAGDPARLASAIQNLARREPMFRRLLDDLDKSRPQSGITFSMEGE